MTTKTGATSCIAVFIGIVATMAPDNSNKQHHISQCLQSSTSALNSPVRLHLESGYTRSHTGRRQCSVAECACSD